MTIAIEKVALSEFEMEYFKFGKGEKTLVILPGLSVQSVMNSARAVADEYAVMKDDFTVWLFDRRKCLPDLYSVHDMAEDTVLAMETLGLKDICLFGASQGGMIALDIAIHHPPLVRKLALGSTTPDAGMTDGETLKKWISLAQSDDSVGLYVEFGRAIYPAEVFDQYRDVLAAAGKSVTQEELVRFIRMAGASEGFCVTDRLTDIQCPVLALGSADDKVLGIAPTETFIEKLGDRPDFSYYIYDGFGHAAYDTAPDYRKRLYDFFVK